MTASAVNFNTGSRSQVGAVHFFVDTLTILCNRTFPRRVEALVGRR